jgi:hypothetical protein
VTDEQDLEQALLIRVRAENAKNPHQRRSEEAVLRKGPRAYKIALLRYFGPPETDEIKKRELRCRTYQRLTMPGGGYDFDEPSQEWFCEGSEIDGLRAFLNADLASTTLLLVTREPGRWSRRSTQTRLTPTPCSPS